MPELDIGTVVTVTHPAFETFKAEYRGNRGDRTVLRLLDDLIASDGRKLQNRGEIMELGLKDLVIEKIELEQNPPLFSVLLQGVIEPQEPCRDLSGQTGGPQPIFSPALSDQEVGQWFAAVKHHRIAILMQLTHPSFKGHALEQGMADTFHTEAATIAQIILQSQALYSGIKLSLAMYTITTVLGPGKPEPMWFGPSLKERLDISARISQEMFSEAADVIAWPAISDDWLQRSLRDYNIALDYDDENSLIFLWRATEDILNAHAPQDSIDDSPKHEPAARNLRLYRVKSRMSDWIREIGTLAHRYARHGSAEVGNVTSDQIRVTRNRVAELIKRHALYRRGQHKFDLPDPDELTGWLSRT